MGHLILDLPFVNNMYYSDFCGENRNHLMCFKRKRTSYREFCALEAFGVSGPPLDYWFQVTAGRSGSYCCCCQDNCLSPLRVSDQMLEHGFHQLKAVSHYLTAGTWPPPHLTYQRSTTISRASYWPNWLMTSALILMVFKKGNF